ncbi:MAG: DUF2855 family protein [Ilumatobacter sp.]
MSDENTTTLEVHRTDIGRTRLVEEGGDVGEGQVRLSIDRFAVTANNITYAVFGEMLGYWDFFPTADAEGGADWGRVPAMGWATVVESRSEEIPLGGRYYGWYPMASHAVFTPMATNDGFRDDGAHRAAHAPVYRAYVSAGSDPMYPSPTEGVDGSLDDAEDRHVLLRGLGLTGFLAEEFFADGGGSGESYFATNRVVVLSASSKTALGFADRAARRDGIEVVGVTSAANRDMVVATGLYDVVVGYDEIDTLATDGGAVSIDMAGNPTALAAVHHHFGDGLAYSMTVGRSHHDAEASPDGEMTGPTPQMFFAPSEVGRRIEQWGRNEYGRRCADAIAGFVTGSHAWLEVEHRSGPGGAKQAWADVHAGSVAPSIGLVARIGGAR